MKKLPAILLGFGIWSLVIGFLPRPSLAACDPAVGHCIFAACAYGPVPGGTCEVAGIPVPGYNCCLDSPPPGTSCETDLGGHCIFTGTCAYGAPLSSSDCTAIGFKCCPDAPAGIDCETDLNGHCTPFAFKCQYSEISSATGCTPILEHCCSNSPMTSSDAAFCDAAKTQVKTALGCLDITGAGTISAIWGWAAGIAGGIAFLVLVYAGFLITTAGGDPKKVKAAQELIVAALSGLVLIVLSVVIFNFIGVKVLNLSGLGFNL